MQRSIIFVIVLLVFGPVIQGVQAQLRDSILLNENAIQRPLTLHQHQLRITAGFDFSIVNSLFLTDGEKIELSDLGVVQSKFVLPITIRYGVLEYLDLGLSLTYQGNTFIDRKLIIGSSLDGLADINRTTTTSGLRDINILLNAQIPFLPRNIDWLFSGAISIPTAPVSADQPTHMAREDTANFTRDIDLEFNDSWGYGQLAFQLGTTFRYKWQRAAASLSGSFFAVSQPTEKTHWEYRLLSDNSFIYRPFNYNMQYPVQLSLEARGEYLLFPWFNTTLDLSYFNQYDGWSEITGKRVAIPDQKAWFLQPGYEILVTHRLWLRQRIRLPLAGESVFSDFGIETILLYNLFVK